MMTRREALAQLGLVGVVAMLIPTVRLAALGPQLDQAYELDGIRFHQPYPRADMCFAVTLMASVVVGDGVRYDYATLWDDRDYNADPQTCRAIFERQAQAHLNVIKEEQQS